MKNPVIHRLLLVVVSTALLCGCKPPPPETVRPEQREDAPPKRILFQLNWLHDPTFVGHYCWTSSSRENFDVVVRPGGANISPITEVSEGRASIAVVGADIFIKTLSADAKAGKEPNVVCIFVDFQRNPVGWVLHPEAARNAGLSNWDQLSGSERNAWLFAAAREGKIQIGDKRGTETTSVWIQWQKAHRDSEKLTVVPVGFDTAVVLSAPKLAYPVYLNEEPYKLGQKIGEPVVVFDPADDGVRLYGNVVICARSLLESEPELIRQLQAAMQNGWKTARDDLDEAKRLVLDVYTGVDEETVKKQIGKTLEFVYDGTSVAGISELTEGGRWHETLRALQDTGQVGHELSLRDLTKYIDVPK